MKIIFIYRFIGLCSRYWRWNCKWTWFLKNLNGKSWLILSCELLFIDHFDECSFINQIAKSRHSHHFQSFLDINSPLLHLWLIAQKWCFISDHFIYYYNLTLLKYSSIIHILRRWLRWWARILVEWILIINQWFNPIMSKFHFIDATKLCHRLNFNRWFNLITFVLGLAVSLCSYTGICSLCF